MAFWKKIFKSKYTGAEIDAAVAKAGTVPAVTSADEGKALVVDAEGKIVAGEVGGGLTEYDYTMPLDYIENVWASGFSFQVNNFTDIDNIYAADVVNFTIPGTEQSPEVKIKLYRQIEFVDNAELPMVIFQAFCVPNAATEELNTFNVSLAAIKDTTPKLKVIITKITTTKGNALSSIL